jgi:hypothetical protein
MVLECIGSNSFILNYEESIYRGNLTVQSYRFRAYSNGVPTGEWRTAGVLNTPNVSDIITTVIEENPLKQWMLFGTTSNYGNTAGSIGAFYAWVRADIPNVDVFLHTEYGHWEIGNYDAPLPHVSSNMSFALATLFGIRNDVYRSEIAANTSIVTWVNDITFRLYSTQAGLTASGTGGLVRNGLVITHQRIGRRYFNIKGYANGNLLGVLNIDTNPSNFFIEPLVRFSSTQPIASGFKSIRFDKQPNQAVEVLVNSRNTNAKDVYIVDLNEQGVVTGRTLIFTFQTAQGKTAPTYSIECISNECPPNTCRVICGDTVCCYGSDGIAVESFPL